MAITRYAGDRLVGLSSDLKPTTISNGATFLETDTGQLFCRISGTWSIVGSAVFSTIDALKAATGSDNQMAYCNATDSWYRYEPSGADYVSDDLSVTTTASGGNTRWLAIAGRYFADGYLPTLATLKATTVLYQDRVIYCAETETWYRYEISGSAYIADDQHAVTTSASGNTRWLATSGRFFAGTFFSTVSDLEAFTLPYQDMIVFCAQTQTWYRYEASGSSYTDDNLSVLSTVNGGNTRWLGVLGQYALSRNVSSGTQANRPSAGTANRIYIPTDGYPKSVDTGSVWRPIVEDRVYTAPPAANTLSLINFTEYRTLTQDSDLLLLTEGGDAYAANSYGAAVVSIPSSGSYSLTVGLEVFFFNTTTAQTALLGLCVTDGTGSTAKVVAYFVYNSGNAYTYALYGQYNTFPGTFGSTPINIAANTLPPSLMSWRWFFKLTDDLTNLTFLISPDGHNWDTMQTVSTSLGRTAHLTPSHIGVFTGHGNPTTAVGTLRAKARIFHWSLA
jgi:hypothetical protein